MTRQSNSGMLWGILTLTILLYAGCDSGTSQQEHGTPELQEQSATAIHNHQESADDHDYESESRENEASHDEWQDIMRVETAVAEIRTVRMSLTVPGTIVSHPDRRALVSPFVDARINQVFVTIGDEVRQGEVLACLTSPDIGLLRAEYDRAAAELDIAKQAHARALRLYEEDILPERSLEEADRDLTVAQVNRDYTYQRLRAIGLLEREIDHRAPCPHGGGESAVHLTAPIDGIITMRSGALGENVDPDNPLLGIFNLDTVWLNADVFVKDLTRIHVGDRVEITVTAYDSVFAGTIFHIGDTVVETTKTVRIQVEFDNPGNLLKPGMYASADVITGIRQNALVVPEEAVLEQDGANIVFVSESEEYHLHHVETGITDNGWIEIIEGIELGEHVVTTGNFQLSSQSAMDSIDPHAGHNH